MVLPLRAWFSFGSCLGGEGEGWVGLLVGGGRVSDAAGVWLRRGVGWDALDRFFCLWSVDGWVGGRGECVHGRVIVTVVEFRIRNPGLRFGGCVCVLGNGGT